MKVLSISINNILGVEEAEIKPNGSVIEITGKNGSGKTSRLKALLDVLGVETSSELIRNGETKAKTVIELDGMRLTKIYTESKPQGTLKVEGQIAGTDSYSTISSPAKVLKGLVSPNSVDPVKLLTASPKELVGAVLESLPMNTDVDKMEDITGLSDFSGDKHALVSIADAQKAITITRRDINRDLKTATITMEELRDTLPDVIQDTSDIEQEIADQQANIDKLHRTARSTKRDAHNGCQAAVDATLEILEKCKVEAAAAERRLIEAQVDYDHEVEQQLLAADKAFDDELDKSIEINDNISELQSSLSEVGVVAKTAERVDSYKKTMKVLSNKAKEFDGQLAELDQYKRDLCDNLPIKGLELVDGKLMLNGVPFSTLNTAKRIGLVLELAKLSVGKLGLIILDGAEALDSDTYEEFIKEASKTDLQFICARVSDHDLEVK